MTKPHPYLAQYSNYMLKQFIRDHKRGLDRAFKREEMDLFEDILIPVRRIADELIARKVYTRAQLLKIVGYDWDADWGMYVDFEDEEYAA